MNNSSIAKKFGSLIRQKMAEDEHFYLFSPDETTSNKLDEAYLETTRAWAMKKEDFDLPEGKNGRIVELLSENALLATMIGHIMNGEQAMMTSYEAFFSIVFSQILQQIKFFKQADEVKWREKYPAVNLLSTSTCWRQDHNGYTHQSPASISALLSVPSNKVNCFFPVDEAMAEEIFDFMWESRNVVNFTTFDKNEEPRWLNKVQAKRILKNSGTGVFSAISDRNPDIILTAVGDIATRETIFAMKIIREDVPETKMKFVSINALSYNAIGTTENKLTKGEFEEIFGEKVPIIANFHGYPETLGGILGLYTEKSRIFSFGFIEEGSTTTPFEMLTRNKASRYDIAIKIAEILGKKDLVKKYQKLIDDNTKYAKENGVDLVNLA